jgi:hypothetical protein
MAFVPGAATTVQVMVNDAIQIGRHERRRFCQFIKDRAVDDRNTGPASFAIGPLCNAHNLRFTLKRILREQLGNHGRVEVGADTRINSVLEINHPAVAVIKTHAVLGGRQ